MLINLMSMLNLRTAQNSMQNTQRLLNTTKRKPSTKKPNGKS